MIYLWGSFKSTSLDLLEQELNNLGVLTLRSLGPAHAVLPTTLIVCWGYSLSPSFNILNAGGPKGDKWKELTLLADANISIPDFSKSYRKGWYARRFHHHSASDLRQNLTSGDYYTEPIACTHEYRVHALLGQTRSALKVPKDRTAHPVFRTHSLGWIFDYHVNPSYRIIEEAQKAVAAVGYDFGAVDVGVKQDGTPVVFEVNSAPTLSPATAAWYSKRLAAHHSTLKG